ncbi:beta-glucosidase-like protein [Emericellopsis cladophorae]|uniref:Probable beta-glucosidase btgE n=1 Tax=Emericellopsis cladophorae TaxID=2686198 RepID=A0A9P9Y9M1_9HYPO|nr:beta-glucosidase-like protein [Emericellopsis cladophorae]KAI6785875.1 beta-glucosidase-like protein [Emericellopsis cladophorae]
MKGGIAAAAFAAMVSSATALNHRHAHAGLHKKNVAETCGCTTIYTYITGEPTLVPNHPPKTTESSSSSAVVTPSSSSVEVPFTTPETLLPLPTTSEEVKHPVPTPEVTTCPTPGTYTIPATTVTVDETTTVCVPTSVHVVPGTHTVGGVTTVVVEATTVTCPVATVTTQPDGAVTSTIVQTEYVCPSAGTYTINPITTTVTEECDVEFPVPTSYNPGTYTAPEQVITVTETDFVYVCPYTSSGLPEPTKVPEAPKAEVTKAESPKETKVETPKETKVEEPKEEEETEVKEPKKETPSKGHFDGSFGGSGDHYGITYTPFEETTGECKSASRVDSDIQEIKNDGFQVVRVYSTDCDTLPSVGAACKKHGLQMLIGLFVKETGCSPDTPEIKEQIDAISEWAQWDLVKLFIVGNESIMNGFCTPGELATLIKTVKSKCPDYTGPYTIAETLDQWLDPSVAGAICDEVDFTGANIHPFFNEANLAKLAGKFVKGQLAILDKICKGKQAVNLECGWPNNGSRCKGQACPGTSQQADALQSIREECGDRTVFFSFGNDAWKEPGEYGCEQFWGSKDYFASL